MPVGTLRSVDSLTWEGDVPQLRDPILVCSFRGWNDAAAAASTALAAVADALDSELIAHVDAEDYFDFQATRPTIVLSEGQARRIEWPQNNLIAARVPGRRPRPGPARRHRAQPALAHLLGDDRDRRRRARGGDGDHPGRADRRGLPHPAGADHRPRLRREAGRGARPAALQLRGPDRDRRRRPRLLPPGRDDLRLALGRRSPLRRRGPQPEGGARPAAPPRGPHRHRRRRHRAGGGSRPATRSRSTARSPPTPRSRSWSSGSRPNRPSSWTSPEDLPSADSIARDFQQFLRQQGNQ